MTSWTEREIETLLNLRFPTFRFACARQADGSYAISLASVSGQWPPITVVGIGADELSSPHRLAALGEELIRSFVIDEADHEKLNSPATRGSTGGECESKEE